MRRGWWCWAAGWGYVDWLAGAANTRWQDAV